jgi:Fe-S oxidoreductase
LADIDSQGYGQIVVFENVRFSELLRATYEVLDWAGLEVVEKIEQPKFNALTIIARDGNVDTMKVQIKSLSETVHELKLFTSSERGTSKKKSFNRDFYQEIEKRLSNNSKKM